MGKLLEPIGELPFEDAVDAFAEFLAREKGAVNGFDDEQIRRFGLGSMVVGLLLLWVIQAFS